MASAKTIEREVAAGFPRHVDFGFLREKGLEHLRALSGETWTDHNSHDPGITMLEAICYALLEAGYRTNLDIADLLAPDPAKSAGKQFFSAAEILGCNPLTVLDFRKLLMDIPGVRNAWLEKTDQGETPVFLQCSPGGGCLVTLEQSVAPCNCPPTGLATTNLPGDDFEISLSGLYKVWLELDPVRPQDQGSANCGGEEGNTLGRILEEARRRLRIHRNLCEDFTDICILKEEQIALCASLELMPDKDPDTVLTEMFVNLRKFLSPALRYYTLQEMIANGKSTDDIFEGRPLLEGHPDAVQSHGFVDMADLKKIVQRTELRVSDLYQVILNTDGIRAVTSLKIINFIGGTAQSLGDEWRLQLTKGYHPVIAPDLSQLVVRKDGVKISFNSTRVAEQVAARLTEAEKSLRQPYELDLLPEAGRYLGELGDYFSIQNDFPRVYGIGEGGLAESEPKLRKAQALQLKGYLLFFDQLLANYLAQLSQFREAFALQTSGGAGSRQGSLDSVPDLAKLVRGGEVAPGGDPITGSNLRYRYGETVLFPYDENYEAKLYDTYWFTSSPAERDGVLRQLVQAFENQEFTVSALEDECGRYFFEMTFRFDLQGNFTEFRLRGRTTFEQPEEAKSEARSLDFLGLQTENYRLVDRQNDGAYSFEILYASKPYAEFVSAIAEPGDYSLRQRDRLLNHLLARFNEDFTEYALLAYAGGKDPSRPDPELVEDKANFLARYDEISRNRGKGFDYGDSSHLWNSDNVTGLENRAAGLMGIDDWQRRTLAPFTVEPGDSTAPFVLKNHRGRPLLRTKKRYLTDLVQQATAWKILEPCLEKPEAFHPVNCNEYGVFGFEVVCGSPDACTLAVHPFTFGCTELRDRKILHLQKLAEGDGLHRELVETLPGWIFQLKDETTGEVLLQSAVPAPDEQGEHGAVLQWVQARRRGAVLENWRWVQSPGGEYSFVLTAKDGSDLALHPHFYGDEDVAKGVLTQIVNLLAASNLDAREKQRPSVWTWELKDPEGLVLLENLHPFATQEQASIALRKALKWASHEQNYERTQDPGTGKFSFFLTIEIPAAADQPAQWLRIARHPHGYDTETERDDALAAALACAGEEAAFTKKLLPKNNVYRYFLTDATGEMVLLKGIPLLPSEAALNAGWEAFLQQAARPENYRIEQGSDSYSVWLADACGEALATAPCVFCCESEALEFIQKTAHFVATGSPVRQHELVDTAWTFQLLAPDGETVAVRGTTWFSKRKEAKAAYFRAQHAARQPENWQLFDGEDVCKIQLLDPAAANDCGEPLAVSPFNFTDPETRCQALEDWRECFSQTIFKACLLECPGEWFFEIRKDGVLVLASLNDYPSDLEAVAALEQAIRSGCLGRFVKKQDGCACSFDLKELNSEAFIATHPIWHETPAACEEAMLELSKCLCESLLPVEYLHQDKSFRWILIWETCDERLVPVLEGVTKHPDEAAAWAELESALQDVNIFLEKDGQPGDWGIFLRNEAGDVVATHPERYLTEAERDAVFDEILAYVARLPYLILPVGSQFRWQLRWRNPATGSVETPLTSVGIYGNEATAIAAFHDDLNSPNYFLGKQETSPLGPFQVVFQDDSGGIIATATPVSFVSEAERDAFFNALKAYLQSKVWWKLTGGGGGSGVYRFRLDKPEAIARHAQVFKYKKHRDDACKALEAMLDCKTPEFSTLVLDRSVVFCVPDGVPPKALSPGVQLPPLPVSAGGACGPKARRHCYFQLKSGGKTLWMSADSYPSPDEAWAAFLENYLDILYFAGDPDHYVPECENGMVCWFWLVDFDGKRIARTLAFQPGDDPQLTFQTLRRHALTYPVIRSGERFCFQLFDLATGKRIFLGTAEYATTAAALAAFHRFLELLRHRENWRKTDDPKAYRYGLEVLEAGLEGVELFPSYLATDAEVKLHLAPEENQAEMPAWNTLNAYLGEYGETFDFDRFVELGKMGEPGSANRLYTRFEALSGCRFGIFWASDEWMLALHCEYFHTPAEREKAKDKLFHLICCGDLLFDGQLFCGYFAKCQLCLPFAYDFGLWFAPTPLPDGVLPSANGQAPCGADTTLEEVDMALATSVVDLMEFARSEDCYVMVAEQQPFLCEEQTPGAPLPVKYRLGLLDDKSQWIALGNTLHDDKASWEAERDEAIRQAWRFPIVRQGRRFGFQVAQPDGTVLFESVRTYEHFAQAWEAFQRFRELACDKNNYGNTETGDCGPFGIALNDPAAILAVHPATYPCRSDLSPALERLENCLDIEGFHLVEHLLLRPRSASDPVLPVCLLPEDCNKETVTDAVLCGADPYSFQATIVMPYWSRRFRDLNFRAFFEKTLRQEAPAHVSLQIVWLNVLTMRRFEQAYRNWLESNALGGDTCYRQSALCQLIVEMNHLRNTYPQATRLAGGLDETNVVWLDNSSLSQ